MPKQKERYTLSLFKRLNIFITTIITKFINRFSELLIGIQAQFFLRKFQKNTQLCFTDYTKAFDCVVTTNYGKFLKWQEYQIILPAS